MRSYYKFILILFIIFGQDSVAQDVSLKVSAPDYNGKNVFLWLEDDFFSRHKSLISQGKIENDHHIFSISIDDISKLRIGIDYQYGSMYVEPGATYEISFPKHDISKNRSFAWNTQVMLSFLELPENDINAQIISFNGDLDAFFSSLLTSENNSPSKENQLEQVDSLENSNRIIKNFSPKESLEKFNNYILTWGSNPNENGSSFFKNYRTYSGASIAYSLGEKKSNLFAMYLLNKQIQYSNPEYVRFFLEYYQNYFDFYNFYPLSKKIEAAFISIDQKKDLLKLISEDTLTGSKQMRELILLKGLYDYYPKHRELDSIITSIIYDISRSSVYPQHREIALNYLSKLNKGKIDTPFPNFDYIRFTGDTAKLSDYKGEMIYLQIFASWSSSSLAEMDLMAELYKRYNSKVKFISLSIDSELQQFFSFVEENRKYKWEIGWIGEHPDIIELLSIYDIPLFYIINSDFEIYTWPALWPSTGAEKTFYEIELKEKEDKKFRFWENQTNKSKREK